MSDQIQQPAPPRINEQHDPTAPSTTPNLPPPRRAFQTSSFISENHMKHLSAVLAAVNIGELLHLASSTFQRLNPNTPPETATIDKPLGGTFNIVFPLTFPCGTRWAIKIPATGVQGKWDALSAKALESEANTMRMLRRETTIPLPDIITFESSIDNLLRVPYILMTFIAGVPLDRVWFGERHGVSAEDVAIHRSRVLDGIAAAMAQLSQYKFHTSGMLKFNKDGSLDREGPDSNLHSSRRYDMRGTYDRIAAGRDGAVWAEAPPSSDPKDHYTFFLDRYPPQPECLSYQYMQPLHALTRKLISWIPEPEAADGRGFVLAHPDLDLQNVIVSREGEVRGIIDWDGVGAVPRSCGCEAYPEWLMGDWRVELPFEVVSDDEDGDEDVVDSPEVLAKYKGVYRELLRKYQGLELTLDANKLTSSACDDLEDGSGKDDGGVCSDLGACSLSLFTRPLKIATTETAVPDRDRGMIHLIKYIWRLEGDDKPPYLEDLGEVICEGDGDGDSEMVERLHRGFLELIARGELA
ncbi:kinase-like domain-containing protein [Aspergillus karnatakaensis]|uniref:phosphotransferase family protein n=1 Tax=Aspergillus karnatakaensis TaxID=1810916 RepID=UPI003CCCAB44